ncbi:MAG TPA: hypothetical protein VF669_19825 [Tepidisphaeraceae bacterium]|jgi:hypothetical protein
MKFVLALLLSSIVLTSVGCRAHGDVDTDHDRDHKASIKVD